MDDDGVWRQLETGVEGVHAIFDAANDHFYGSFGVLQYLGNEVRKRDLST